MSSSQQEGQGSFRVKSARWRWWGLYSRRHFLTAMVALLVVVGALLKALSLLAVADPPNGKDVSNPEILLDVFAPPSARGVGLTTFDVVGLFIRPTGCGNPVQVTLGIGLRGQQSLPAGRYASGQGDVSGQIIDPTHTAKSFREGVVRGHAGWDAEFGAPGGGQVFTDLPTKTEVGLPAQFGAPGFDPGAFTVSQSWHPAGLPGKEFAAPVDGWFAESASNPDTGVESVNEPVLELGFLADWSSPRGYGTCYIRLPDVMSVPVLPNHGGLAPGRALVELQPTKGETVDTSSSAPAPSDPRNPMWTCSIGLLPQRIENGCGGFAVLQTPGAGQHQQFFLLFIGAVLGLGLAIAAQALLQWNWPLPERTPHANGKNQPTA